MGRLIDSDLKPRTIDIDILLFENEQRDSPELIIPHPRMLLRDFCPQTPSRNHPKLRRAISLLS